MKIAPFRTEEWFAEFEFTARHLLAASDCESMTVGALLALAGETEERLLKTSLRYTEPSGSAALREQIARASGPEVDPDWVIVLSAPQEGIFLTMNVLLEPGCDVVVVDPCYDSLRQVPAHVGARLHPWRARAVANQWGFDLGELASLLERIRPALVIVNFPHNPTGAHLSPPQQRELSEMVRASGARLFFDEMYRGLEWHPSSERLPGAAQLGSHAIALGGLSKAYGLPGLRCGWLICSDADVRERLSGWRNYTTICPPAPVEALARVALQTGETLLTRSQALVKRNIALAGAFFEPLAPAFFWRPPLAGSVALIETAWPSATPACRIWAREHGVVLLPGEFLGAPPNTLRLGLGRASFAEGLAAWKQGGLSPRLAD